MLWAEKRYLLVVCMSETVSTGYRFDNIEAELTEAPSGRSALFNDTDFRNRLKHRLDTMLDGSRILSLDVFDTLILRDNSSELTRFYEIGGIMAAIVQDETGGSTRQVDAFVARHLGTKATYRASRLVNGCREGSLTELHATASRLLTGHPNLAAAFVEAEVRYEATRIAPNPFLVDYVADYRANGGRAVLVTDMYMHADQVARLLSLIGLDEESYDLLISSADTKASKASGGIFPLVEKEMGVGPDQFVHLGDSFRGDVAQPLRAGWKAMHLPLANADIVARRRDHLATQEKLASEHSLAIDVAMPH